MKAAASPGVLPSQVWGFILAGLLLLSLAFPLREPEVRAMIWSSSTGAFTSTAPLAAQRGPDLGQLDDGTVVVGDPRDGQAYDVVADRWHHTDVYAANPFPPWNPSRVALPPAIAQDVVSGARWPDGAMLAVGNRAAFFRPGGDEGWTPVAAGPSCDVRQVAAADPGRALLLCNGIPARLYALAITTGTWTPLTAPEELRLDTMTVGIARLVDGRVMVLAGANERRLLPFSVGMHVVGLLAAVAFVVALARASRSGRRRVLGLLAGAALPLLAFVGWLLVTFAGMSALPPR